MMLVSLHKLHQPLTHRGLVRMSGDDSTSFINMNQFDPSQGHGVMYTFLLNSLVSVCY